MSRPKNASILEIGKRNLHADGDTDRTRCTSPPVGIIIPWTGVGGVLPASRMSANSKIRGNI